MLLWPLQRNVTKRRNCHPPSLYPGPLGFYALGGVQGTSDRIAEPKWPQGRGRNSQAERDFGETGGLVSAGGDTDPWKFLLMWLRLTLVGTLKYFGCFLGCFPCAYKQVHSVLPLPHPGMLWVLTHKLCSILPAVTFHLPAPSGGLLYPGTGHLLSYPC